MNEHAETPAAENPVPEEPASENPFSTNRVRPGALPFFFSPGEDLRTLIDRLRRHGWWGQIVGPHGSGKTALLATLAPAIEDAGRHVLRVELHDAQRKLPLDLKTLPHSDRSLVLIVDGYEQLSHWNRYRLKRVCRRNGLGLVVTAHGTVGLPDLFRAAVSLDLARQIVVYLQQGHDARVTAEDVAERLAYRGGNLRETLFDLYDRFEERRREKGPS